MTVCCKCPFLVVRTKLEIPADVEITFVLADDGCQVDRSDILDMLPLPTLMILRSCDNWTKVIKFQVMHFMSSYGTVAVAFR